jgi:hypothetical protein
MPGNAMTPVSFAASGVAIDMADGETKERVDVTLARWGSIEGHLLDELGDPLQGASVQLLQVRYQKGRRPSRAGRCREPSHRRSRAASGCSGLAPGQYVVSAAGGRCGIG